MGTALGWGALAASSLVLGALIVLAPPQGRAEPEEDGNVPGLLTR